MNLKKHIWEGWTVQNFIAELEDLVEYVVNKNHIKSITTKAALKDFCKENQPYYKKHIPEVVDYFAKKYNLK